MLTIAKIDRYDLVNNPGDSKPSVTLWFSGCSMNCIGCHNIRLQDKSNGIEYNASTVLFTVTLECDRNELNTVVLLGGEPLEQDRRDLETLLYKLWLDGKKVWLYTGYEFDQIPDIIKKYLYTIKSGKFDANLIQDKFPASSNQKIHRLIDNQWTEITL